MSRYFSLAGPCNADDHYMIDTGSLVSGLLSLIDNARYFLIHTDGKSGKTTLLLDLTDRLNKEGKYYALYCSLEALQGVTDPEKGIPAVLSCIEDRTMGRQDHHGSGLLIIFGGISLFRPHSANYNFVYLAECGIFTLHSAKYN